MTFKFSKAAALDVAGKTAEYTLHEWTEEPKPVLVLKAAGTENRSYFNALLARMGTDGVRALKAKTLTADNLDKAREAAIALFPEHVIAGWRNVLDDDGNAVPFSAAACAAFLGQLPGWVIDGIRGFCDDPGNFVGRARIDAEAIAGN